MARSDSTQILRFVFGLLNAPRRRMREHDARARFTPKSHAIHWRKADAAHLLARRPLAPIADASPALAPSPRPDTTACRQGVALTEVLTKKDCAGGSECIVRLVSRCSCPSQSWLR
jgi:hypothetical protein